MVIWPKNKKIAVVLTFDFDGETYWIGKNERSTKVFANLSRGQYGPHEGIYRVLNMLDELEVKGTFFVPGYIAETYQDQVKMIHEKGHEIGYHGYMKEQKRGISREEELARMEKCEAILAGITEKKPVGHRGPGGVMYDYSVEMFYKRGYIYSSNHRDVDGPFFHRINGKEIPFLEFPKDSLYDDGFYMCTLSEPMRESMKSPREAIKMMKAEFDGLAEEGGRMITFVFHPQLSGHPGRLRVLSEFIGYMKAHGACFMRSDEAARYLIEQHGPFEPIEFQFDK